MSEYLTYALEKKGIHELRIPMVLDHPAMHEKHKTQSIKICSYQLPVISVLTEVKFEDTL